MPSRSGIVLLVIGLALAVGVVALLSPWWAITFVSQGDDDGVRHVGPFDSGDGLIDAETARLSGVIAVSALVALGASVALLGFGLGTHRAAAIANAPLVALAGGALLVLALAFVVLAYPADFGPAASFWGGDVATDGPTGFTRVDAAYGWHLGVVAVILAGAGAALGLLKRDAPSTGAQKAEPPGHS